MKLRWISSAWVRTFRRPARRSPALGIWALWILILVPRPSEAQFQQYVAPGEFDLDRESQHEQLERAMQEARWRAGRFYFTPWLSLRDMAYIDNVGSLAEGDDKQSDFTAKVGLGLQGYAPVGSEVTFAFHALPEYVWWADLAGRRQWNGHYGAGLFGDLGRTGFEASVARIDDSVFFSRELEEPVNTTEERLDLNLEFEIAGPVSLFVGGYGRTLSFEEDPDNNSLNGVDQLDRDELVYRAGFKVDLGHGLQLGAGAEFSEADFDNKEFDRSNSGTSPILQLDYEGTLFTFQSNLVFLDLKPDNDSGFVPYDNLTGKMQLSYIPAGRSEFQLFWNSNLVYTRDTTWTYFTDQSVGVAFLTSLGSSSSVRLFYETGDNEYITFDGGLNDRTDDFDAWGVTFRLNFGRTLLTLGTSQTDYTSNLPEFDRKVTVLRSGLSFRVRGGFPWT